MGRRGLPMIAQSAKSGDYLSSHLKWLLSAALAMSLSGISRCLRTPGGLNIIAPWKGALRSFVPNISMTLKHS